MSRGNGTGPNGMGPMTGRGAGYCAGHQVPGFMNNAVPGRGFGRGRGKGYGRRFGPRFVPNYVPNYQAAPPNNQAAPGAAPNAGTGYAPNNQAGPYNSGVTRENEVEYLKNTAQALKNELQAVEERLEEIENKGD